MPIRSTSGYFNDPAFAQAASNLSALFQPPSGADAAGWATAEAKRAEASRLAQFYDYSTAPDFDQSQFDRMGVAAGAYAPNQSFYSVDQSNATQRYGYDTSAATLRANNSADNTRALQERQMLEAAAMDRLGVTDATERYKIGTTAGVDLAKNRMDNQRGAITSLYGALNPGQVAPPVPDDLMSAIGLPGIDQRNGTPALPTEAEVKGLILQGMEPPLQRAVAFGSTPVENIVTEAGPRIATRLDAIGQEPVINKGAEAKPTNAMALLPNGSRVPAIQDPSGRWVHAQTRQELPADVQIFDLPKPQGSAEDVGLTSATQSRVQQQVLSMDQMLDTATTLRGLIESSPSSQGLVGSLRGTAQDIIATGGDLGSFFGGAVQEANQAVRSGMMDAGMAAENFDPSIPAIQMMTNLLAWQHAKAMSGDRVSNEQFRASQAAIGGTGLFANRQSSLTRLDQLMQSTQRQREALRPLAPGVQTGSLPPAPPPVVAPAGGGTRLRFDENGNPL